MMKSESRFSREVILRMRDEIESAGGNEILCAGNINEDGIVDTIVIGARGTDNSVPALLPYIEKGDVVIHNHPSGVLKPSEADLSVAGYLGNQGIGFFIVDNKVENVYAVAEPVSFQEQSPLDCESLRQYLEPGSGLSGELDFERRQSQIDMLAAVCSGFNEDKFCILEAGTGVGKSFAYLIPAIRWAEQNNERIVVSTGTINLQTQLIEKDIPLVKKITGSAMKAVLVKGRGNYLCYQRLEDALSENSLFTEETDEIKAIEKWASASPAGSVSDLPFVPAKGLWSRVNSESDHCLGIKCGFREKCFVLKARKEAGSANILVVNHHLLFADISIRYEGTGYSTTAVLPPYKRIIFDEAHNIESSATSFFSRTLSKYGIIRQLNRLYDKRGKTAAGAAVAAQKLSPNPDSFKEIPSLVEKVKSEYDEHAARIIDSFSEGSTLHLESGIPGHFRDTLEEAMAGLQKAFIDLGDELVACYREFSEAERDEPPVHELFVLANRLRGFGTLCQSFRRWQDNGDKVYWIERNKDRRGTYYLRFNETPVDVAPLLKEALFDVMETLVFSSATLSIGRSFDFWKTRIGLIGYEDREINGLYPSPFPYKTNVLLGIPADAPDPTTPEYIWFFINFVRELVMLSEGKALLLFTSYSMLQNCYQELAPGFREAGYRPLRQGDDDRARLLDSFKEDIHSVLFATDSFWEGIDSPGETLEMLVISRLPFRVPDEPVVKARSRRIKDRGGNPFYEMSLPEAVMKLKQGFGRLIRSSKDKGSVIIADNRLLTKAYGGMFLESLPETGRSFNKSQTILRDIENFFY